MAETELSEGAAFVGGNPDRAVFPQGYALVCLPATAGRLGFAMGSNTCNEAELHGGRVSLRRIPG